MSHNGLFLQALLAGEKVTPAMAYERWGCLALHSRAADLRRMGYRVRCKIKSKGKKRWGEYTLDREAPKGQVLLPLALN